VTPSARARRVEHIWGTAIGVDVGDAADDEVLDRVFGWFRRVDDLFSTWRDDTEISRLGRGELELRDASPEVHAVLDLSDRITDESRGAFDIRIGADPRVDPQPGRGPLDASGLVKGWALERAAELLLAAGVANFSINAGGDLVTRGRPEPDRLWRVGIQHPWHRHAVAAVVQGTDLAVATSGRYELGEHIIDPRTGRHPTGLMAVTVIGADLALADGYATAAIVLGDEGMHWLATLPDIEALGITDSQAVVTTDGFARYRTQ
jgi:thiamine biosynthesis lipoprotein